MLRTSSISFILISDSSFVWAIYAIISSFDYKSRTNFLYFSSCSILARFGLIYYSDVYGLCSCLFRLGVGGMWTWAVWGFLNYLLGCYVSCSLFSWEIVFLWIFGLASLLALSFCAEFPASDRFYLDPTRFLGMTWPPALKFLGTTVFSAKLKSILTFPLLYSAL